MLGEQAIQIMPSAGVLGIDPQGRGEVSFRLVESLLLRQQAAEVVVGFRVFRINAQGLFEFAKRNLQEIVDLLNKV